MEKEIEDSEADNTSGIEIVNEEPVIENKDLEDYDTEELWDTVGFHRITGGFFYGYVLLIGGAIVGLFTVEIITTFLPFPEINGYKGMVASILGFWFGLMDLNMGGGGGFSDSMGRFIGQYSDTNPRRAVKYIQFYVWFQMITGIIQVTAIAIVVLTSFVGSNLSYLSWMILVQSLVQYPGMLMLMESCLHSFQRGDKTAWLSWLQDTVFQVTVNIVCLMIGAAWGDANPAIGRIMGITIFYILSQFLDDWINLFIGSAMFNKVLKNKGIDEGVWSIFLPQFDKEIVKECLKFTGKQWIGNQILGLFGYFINLYIIIQMPQMASWTGLLLLPTFLGHLVSMQGPMMGQAGPAISESYNNGKKELAQYFYHDLLKWYMFVTLFMAISLVILTPPILDTIIGTDIISGLDAYKAGLIMVPLIMLRDALSPLRGLWSKLFVYCNKPMPPIYINYIFTPTGYFFQFLFIYLCIDIQVLPVWYLLILPAFVNDSMKMVVGFIWLQKTTIQVNLRRMWMQVIISPLLTAVAYAIVLVIFQYTLWPIIEFLFTAALGDIGKIIWAALVLLLAIFIFPFLLFSPLYAFFGGWDEFTLEELKRTAVISGPSKFLVMGIYKISVIFDRLSPWSNKYPIADYDVIKRQVKELVAEGKVNRMIKK